MSLFHSLPEPETSSSLQPLAERMRPRTLDEFIGQEKLLGPGKPLRLQIENDNITSMLFWGPPGCGKTTLARIIARLTKSEFVAFSAVTSGIKEIKEVMADSEHANPTPASAPSSSSTKSIASTNPSRTLFSRTSKPATSSSSARPRKILRSKSSRPLLSRTKVYVLEAHTTPQIVQLLNRAIADKDRGLPP